MASKTLLFCMITASEQERSDPTAHNVRIARIHQRFVDFLHRSVQKRVPVVAHHAPRHRRVQRRQQRRVQRSVRASLAAERLAEQSEELGERFGADFALLPMRKRPKKERARWNGRPAARPAACCARGAAARAAAGGRRRRSRCPSANRRGTRRRRQLHYGSWKRRTRTLLVGELEHAAHGFEAELAAVVGLGVHAVAQREKTKQIPLEGLGEGRAGEDVLVERGHDAGILRTKQ